MQAPPIRRQGSGQRVEGDLLAAIGPQRVARDLGQHLEAVHELDDAAGLKPLPRVGVSGPAILIAGKASARELAIQPHDCLVISLGGGQEPGLLGLLIIHARLAETLRQVHVVPVAHTTGPVLHVLVNPPGQLQQPGFAGAVVEPLQGFDVVAEPDPRPVTRAKVLARLGVQPLEILRQERQHPRIAAVLVERLQHIAHHHVRPQVRLAL